MTVSAGLLFVFAFGVGLCANCLAVGHFRRMQREFHVVALAKLGNDHLDMLLSGTGEQKFFRLRIAPEAQREILFENPVNRDADAIFVRARLWFNCERDRRFGNARGRVEDRCVFIA